MPNYLRRSRLLNIAAAVTLASCPPMALGVGHQVELPDVEIEGALPAFDIETNPTTPLGLEIIKEIGLKFRDSLLRANVTRELNALTPQIAQAIGTNPLGYLVRANILIDEQGTPYIPAGEIVTPIGVGSEPLDALAEFFRADQISAASPSSLRDQAFYLWIRRTNGKLTAQIIPNVAKRPLDQNATAEARRRSQLANYYQALPSGGLKLVQRANFWIDTYNRYSAQIKDQATLAEINDLNRQALAAQQKVNTLLTQFNDIENHIAQSQKAQQFLSSLSTVVGLVKTGAELGKLMCATDGGDGQTKDVSPAGAAVTPISTLLVIQKSEENYLTASKSTTYIQLQTSQDQLNTIDNSIQQKWDHSGASVPPSNPQPR